MNRVVLRAQPSTSSSSSNNWWYSLVPPFIVVAVATAAASFNANCFVYDKTPIIQWKSTAIFSILIIIFFLILLYYYRTKKNQKHKFIEAIVEVSPLGVQLLSIYSSSSSSGSSETMTSKTSSTPSKINEVRLHAFIPYSCILDVIVHEVVWSHCVWSQVVFRIIDENYTNINYNTNANNDRVQQQQDQQRIVQHQKLFNQCTAISTIIPAFYPKECQGMMTYMECLSVQAKIEELMMCNFPTPTTMERRKNGVKE